MLHGALTGALGTLCTLHGLIKTLRGIVEESGVPKASIVEEARGMRPDDHTRPGNLVVLDFAERGPTPHH